MEQLGPAHRAERFGQHFLERPGPFVMAPSGLPGDVFLKIGPGHGALTEPLAKLVRRCRVRIDRDLVRSRQRGLEHVTIVKATSRSDARDDP